MDLRSESGYTLVETLVAMTLFISVLIPLSATVANSLLMSDTSHERKALSLAYSELVRASMSPAIGTIEQSKDGFVVKTETMQEGRVIQITVRVMKRDAEKPLAILHKSLLEHEQGR